MTCETQFQARTRFRPAGSGLPCCLLFGFLLAFSAPVLLGQDVGNATETPTESWRWLGKDGKPLPFTTPEELERFLETAEVVAVEGIPVGVTKPKKITLEKDGVRMHAVFRYLDIFKRKWKTARGVKVNFRDSCMFEVGAYRLSRLLGMRNVPPTVVREVEGKKGSVQAWVTDAMTEQSRREKELEAPNPMLWMYQYQVMWLFDNLIYNDDRNKGNILIDKDWKVWLIDATRGFRPVSELRNPSTIRFCEKTIWQNLRMLDDDTLKECLDPFLGSFELGSLLKRRRMLIEHIEKLIEERGESTVLFELPS